jgi:hypothetical protein
MSGGGRLAKYRGLRGQHARSPQHHSVARLLASLSICQAKMQQEESKT